MLVHLRTALLVSLKELRSSLRDRQTLLYMVVLPFALYPVLFWVLLQGAAFLEGRDEARTVRVGLVQRAEHAALVKRTKDVLEPTLDEDDPTTGGPTTGEPTTDDPRTGEPGARTRAIRTSGVPRAELHERGEDLVRGKEAPFDVLLDVASATGTTDAAVPKLYFDSTRSASVLAKERVEARLEPLIAGLRGEAMEQAGAQAEELSVLRLETRDVANQRDRGAYIFSLLLPMMFAFMGILGAFFPAVDVTAGERERNTVETTWLLPVPRPALYAGKVLAVTIAATVAAGLNLLGMALAAEHLLSGLAGDGAAFQIVIPWSRLVAVLPLGFLFLMTTSALLVAGASFTKTFKQGQSLLGTVQLVLLAPAFVGVLPGLALSTGLALVPIVQTVLAFRTILQDGLDADRGLLALVLVSQLVYALAASALAVWLAGRESVPLPAFLRRRSTAS